MTDLDSIRARWADIAREDAELTIDGDGAQDLIGLQLWTRSGAHRDLDAYTQVILENVCADVAHLLALIDRHGITDSASPTLRSPTPVDPLDIRKGYHYDLTLDGNRSMTVTVTALHADGSLLYVAAGRVRQEWMSADAVRAYTWTSR